jgi:hypothetical protein
LSILERTPALDQINDENNDCDHDQEMNQTAADVHRETKKPKYEQNNEDSPEHRLPFALSLYDFVSRGPIALMSILDSVIFLRRLRPQKS